jgi:hypothetical protein
MAHVVERSLMSGPFEQLMTRCWRRSQAPESRGFVGQTALATVCEDIQKGHAADDKGLEEGSQGRL